MRSTAAAGLATLLLAAGATAVSEPGRLGGGLRPAAADGEDRNREAQRARQPVTGGSGSPDERGEVEQATAQRPQRARGVARRQVGGLGAQLRRPTWLRRSPAGGTVRGLDMRTRFGGPVILTVVARRGPWLGVLHEALGNGRAGWVHEDNVRLLRERWHIRVDRSARRAVVRRDGRVVDRFPVGVGRPESPTPLGRFGVTDRMVTGGSSSYGCCILALTGRQPHLPAGWRGGDRLALHGGTDDRIGDARSAGCVNVRNADMRRLIRRIPVGTRVDITA